MNIDRTRRCGTIAVAGGAAAVLGALWPSDLVFLAAAGATATLAWVAWQLGRGLHDDRNAIREAGGAITTAGLGIAAVGFLVALFGALSDRPDLVLVALSAAVATGLYVVLPLGLILLGVQALRWRVLSAVGRALPLAIGVCGVLAIPATFLISLPGFEPGRLATNLVLAREMVLIGWIPLGVAMRRALPLPRA